MNACRTLGVCVILAIAVGGCGAGGAPASQLAGPFSTHTVDATSHLLASSGVEVFANLSDPKPELPISGTRSPLRVWAWQARNLAAETAAGGGLPGAVIDVIAPVPQGTLPLSYLLAAYVSQGQTAGALALRDLMGSRDWRHPQGVVFPTLALGLLASDVARSVRGPSTRLAAAVRPSLVTNPCSVVDQWVNDTLNLLFDALQRITSALLPTFLADLVKIGLALAQGAIKGLLKAIEQSVLDAIRGGISLLALVFEAASVLKPWSLRMQSSPQPNSYSHRPGSVTLSVIDQGPIDWPQPLQDCARTVTGNELPQLRGAANAPVAWKVDGVPDTQQHPPLVAVDGFRAAYQISLDLFTRADRTASLAYVTNGEDTACSGAAPVITSYVVSADVTRVDAETVRRLVPNLLGSVLGKIPDILQPIFRSAVNEISARVSDALLQIAGHDAAFAVVAIEHHEGGASCVSPSTPAPPPLQPGRCLLGHWVSSGISDPHLNASGGAGADLKITDAGGGTLQFTMDLSNMTPVQGSSGPLQAALQFGGTETATLQPNGQQLNGNYDVSGLTIDGSSVSSLFGTTGGVAFQTFTCSPTHLDLINPPPASTWSFDRAP